MTKMRLTAAGLGIYLGLLLVHTLLILTFTGSDLKRQFSQDAFSYARMSVRTVADAHESYYASGYYKFREMVSDVMRLNPDLERLSLIDVDGRVLFDSREFEEGKPAQARTIDDPEVLAAVKGVDISCWMTKEPGGGNYLDIVAPYLEEWGRHRVSVRYLVRYRSWGEQRLSLAYRILLAGLVSMALGAAAIIYACGRIQPKNCGGRP